jgi:hypothetical protein
MKQNQNLLQIPTSHDDHHGGSFAVGFLVGVITGAIGLWTTQNEQGRSLLARLKDEFLETIEEEKKIPISVTSSSSGSSTKSSKKFPKFSASRLKRS